MISSGAGRRGYPLRSPYAAAKWAMIGLTQTLAGEWGQRGIRVNCICPGAIEGDRIERVMRARAESLGQPYEVVREGFLSGAALHRMATEDEVARVSLFIVTEAERGGDGPDHQRRLRKQYELTARHRRESSRAVVSFVILTAAFGRSPRISGRATG